MSSIVVPSPSFDIQQELLIGLQQLVRGTRKLLPLPGIFYRTSDVDRLYVSRQLGGRGLISVFQC